MISTDPAMTAMMLAITGHATLFALTTPSVCAAPGCCGVLVVAANTLGVFFSLDVGSCHAYLIVT
jgi:hypothetical protein